MLSSIVQWALHKTGGATTEWLANQQLTHQIEKSNLLQILDMIQMKKSMVYELSLILVAMNVFWSLNPWRFKIRAHGNAQRRMVEMERPVNLLWSKSRKKFKNSNCCYFQTRHQLMPKKVVMLKSCAQPIITQMVHKTDLFVVFMLPQAKNTPSLTSKLFTYCYYNDILTDI